jgi:hypothetical protein
MKSLSPAVGYFSRFDTIREKHSCEWPAYGVADIFKPKKRFAFELTQIGLTVVLVAHFWAGRPLPAQH